MSDSIRKIMCLNCCPKCGGALFRECDIYGCDVQCLQCGYIMPRTQLEEMIGKDQTEALLSIGNKRAKPPEPEPESRPKRGRRKTT